MLEGQEADLVKTGFEQGRTDTVDNITIENAEQQATNRVHWRGLIHRRKELLCGAGHSND